MQHFWHQRKYSDRDPTCIQWNVRSCRECAACIKKNFTNWKQILGCWDDLPLSGEKKLSINWLTSNQSGIEISLKMIQVYIISENIMPTKSCASFRNGTWICCNEELAENWRNMHNFQELKEKNILSKADLHPVKIKAL